jgi:hypothetical protein
LRLRSRKIIFLLKKFWISFKKNIQGIMVIPDIPVLANPFYSGIFEAGIFPLVNSEVI